MYLGGYDGQNFLTNVEMYDPERNAWEEGDPLPSGRSGHACAVCYQNLVPNLCMHARPSSNHSPNEFGTSRHSRLPSAIPKTV